MAGWFVGEQGSKPETVSLDLGLSNHEGQCNGENL